MHLGCFLCAEETFGEVHGADNMRLDLPRPFRKPLTAPSIHKQQFTPAIISVPGDSISLSSVRAAMQAWYSRLRRYFIGKKPRERLWQLLRSGPDMSSECVRYHIKLPALYKALPKVHPILKPGKTESSSECNPHNSQSDFAHSQRRLTTPNLQRCQVPPLRSAYRPCTPPS